MSNSGKNSPRRTESLPSPRTCIEREIPTPSVCMSVDLANTPATPTSETRKTTKIDDQMMQNLIELQFHSSLKVSKPEWPNDWYLPNQSVTNTNPFLEPISTGIIHNNPFLEPVQTQIRNSPRPPESLRNTNASTCRNYLFG